jgi:monoamine oxidase
MTDVIIIGAGMAGLSAALELRARGIDTLILEAQDHPGGRARTVTTETGTPVDLGAHWMHGEDTPLKALLDRYGIEGHRDHGDNLLIVEGGRVRTADADDWLEGGIDHKRAEGIRNGTLPDCPLPDLATSAQARGMLTEFGLMWNGLEPPLLPSAFEFLTDENTPGGLEVKAGVGAVISRMAGEAGSIEYGVAVTAVAQRGDRVEVHAAERQRQAKAVMFTGSLGVLKGGAVAFDPPFSPDTQALLDGLVMGTMNKIVAELDPAFFAERNIPVDQSLELLDGDPPHYCHVNGAGLPLINLYVSGKHAVDVETMDQAAALAHLRQALSPVDRLHGWEDHLKGPLLLSAWGSNPYVRGAYSAALPGTRRSGPRKEGRLILCGDTFDPRFPASLAGAFLSGQAAARMVAELV